MDYIESADFKGYDPYDALNNPLLSGLSLGNIFLRIGCIQILKRLFLNKNSYLDKPRHEFQVKAPINNLDEEPNLIMVA